MHLQTLPNVCLLLTEYNNRSSISDEIVDLLKCNCLFVTEEGTSRAEEMVCDLMPVCVCVCVCVCVW